MEKRKSKIGFSVLDMFIILLAALCVLSFIFRDQIRGVLSGDEGVKIEYTFLIQNASEKARNCPTVGEKIYQSKDLSPLGVLMQVAEVEKEYRGSDDEQDVMKIRTLTCNAAATARFSDRGYVLGNAVIKPGAEILAETENASFTMIITMVRTVDE